MAEEVKPSPGRVEAGVPVIPDRRGAEQADHRPRGLQQAEAAARPVPGPPSGPRPDRNVLPAALASRTPAMCKGPKIVRLIPPRNALRFPHSGRRSPHSALKVPRRGRRFLRHDLKFPHSGLRLAVISSECARTDPATRIVPIPAIAPVPVDPTDQPLCLVTLATGGPAIAPVPVRPTDQPPCLAILATGGLTAPGLATVRVDPMAPVSRTGPAMETAQAATTVPTSATTARAPGTVARTSTIGLEISRAPSVRTAQTTGKTFRTTTTTNGTSGG